MLKKAVLRLCHQSSVTCTKTVTVSKILFSLSILVECKQGIFTDILSNTGVLSELKEMRMKQEVRFYNV